MKPTDLLVHEHDIILVVLEAVEHEAASIGKTGKIDAGKIEKMLDFFRNFVDRCHHAKEEKHLFVRMQERGMSKETGPLAVMLADHDEGRRRVRAVAGALPIALKGDQKSIALIRENLLAYV